MTLVTFGFLLTGVLLNAVAQLLLKAGTNAVGQFEYSMSNLLPVGFKLFTEPHIFGGLCCYVISVGVWIAGLSRVPVSVAYPMLSLGYVVNAALAYYLFGEAITMQKTAGIVLIIIGVYLVARS